MLPGAEKMLSCPAIVEQDKVKNNYACFFMIKPSVGSIVSALITVLR